MKEQNESGKSHTSVRNKKLYMYIALGCAAVLLAAAIIITSVALASRDNQLNHSDTTQGGSSDDDQDVINTPEEFGMPVEVVSISNEYGFYYNQTLNNYYEHTGVDFSAAAGTEVFAARSGKIESIYTSDVLVGTQIIIDHGDGIKTVYEYVEAKEGLKAGDEVKKGDVIARRTARNIRTARTCISKCLKTMRRSIPQNISPLKKSKKQAGRFREVRPAFYTVIKRIIFA